METLDELIRHFKDKASTCLYRAVQADAEAKAHRAARDAYDMAALETEELRDNLAEKAAEE